MSVVPKPKNEDQRHRPNAEAVDGTAKSGSEKGANEGRNLRQRLRAARPPERLLQRLDKLAGHKRENAVAGCDTDARTCDYSPVRAPFFRSGQLPSS